MKIFLLLVFVACAASVTYGKLCDAGPETCASFTGAGNQTKCKASGALRGSRCVRVCDCNHGTFTTHHVIPEDVNSCTGDCGKCAFIYQVDDQGRCSKQCLCTGLGINH